MTHLTRFRRRAGLSRKAVAGMMGLRPCYVRFLEAGKWDRLPKGAYPRYFVRRYLAVLGVPSERAARLAGEFAPPAEPAQKPGRRTSALFLLPLRFIAAGAAAAAVLAYLAFHAYRFLVGPIGG